MAEWVINTKFYTRQTVSCMCARNVDNELKKKKKKKFVNF